jgi:hypothetical protein
MGFTGPACRPCLFTCLLLLLPLLLLLLLLLQGC